MDSWRDTASTSAQDDLEGLLELVLPFAEDQLRTHGEFYPFGAAVSTTGESSLTAAGVDLEANPPSDQVLGALYEGARASAGGLRAVAFVADVWASGSDAVRVELEHREGVTLLLLRPYFRSRFKRTLSFEPMRVSPGEPRVWLEPGSAG